MAKQLTDAETKELMELCAKHRSASSCIWSLNMLRALENGVKGSKWYSLKDKICREIALKYGFYKVLRNDGGSGVDGNGTKLRIFEMFWVTRPSRSGAFSLLFFVFCTRPGRSGYQQKSLT